MPRESGDAANDINCRCFVEYNFMSLEEFAKKTGRSVDEVQKSFGNAEKTEKTVDTEAKIKYNKDDNRDKADREQYNTYKEILGKNAPKSFEEFQNLKYGDAETWDLFKSYKRAIDSGELTPLADFYLYQKTDDEMKNKIVGKTTIAGTEIKGGSKHLISRVIGSVEQKRNGVSVDDVLEALTNPNSRVLGIREQKNGKSQKYRYNGVEVSVNPTTGNVIQVNPLKRGGKDD